MSLDHEEFSDGELMVLCTAGRTSAFTEVMKRHRNRVYRVALLALGDPEEALDVVQDTFLAAHRACARFDPKRELGPWLATIALNKARDMRRRRRLRAWLSFAAGAGEAEAAPDPTPGAEAALEARRELARVARAIADLPASQRDPLVLHTVENMKQSDIAKLLNISDKAVETRLRRARQSL